MFRLFIDSVVVLILFPKALNCEVRIDNRREIEAFAQATNEILLKSVKELETVRVVTYSENDTRKFDDVIDGLVKHSEGKLIFKFHNIEKVYEKSSAKDICKGTCLFLFESLELFSLRQLDVTLHNGRNGNLFIAHVDQSSAKEITEDTNLFDELHPKLHFIVNADRNFIDLIVVVACHKVQSSEVLNRYTKEMMTWQKTVTSLSNKFDQYSCNVSSKLSVSVLIVLHALIVVMNFK